MSRNPVFKKLLDEMLEVHDRKSSDYADESNPYSNFEFAAELSNSFHDPVDRVFATLIGIKLARLIQLLSGKSPKNESIDDSFVDATNYFAIWTSYRRTRTLTEGREWGTSSDEAILERMKLKFPVSDNCYNCGGCGARINIKTKIDGPTGLADFLGFHSSCSEKGKKPSVIELASK